MAWTWRYLTSAATDSDDGSTPLKEEFPNQSDAENWIGEHWRLLAAQGVTDVELLEDDRVEYRMSLSESTTSEN